MLKIIKSFYTKKKLACKHVCVCHHPTIICSGFHNVDCSIYVKVYCMQNENVKIHLKKPHSFSIKNLAWKPLTEF